MMIVLPSRLKNTVVTYLHARRKLASQGFLVGGSWDYEQGYFDYLLEGSYKASYLRIPFYTCRGSIEDKNGIIRIGNPYLLTLEDRIGIHKDEKGRRAGIPAHCVNWGLEVIEQAEEALLGS
ncbi:YugN family protein [Pradoshia sp.]|uniref:YugN family protein n=1 Tax=Pradoshia sp. TaxID=2651281 RepID=UPI003F0A699A